METRIPILRIICLRLDLLGKLVGCKTAHSKGGEVDLQIDEKLNGKAGKSI